MKTNSSDRPEIPSIQHGQAKVIEDFQNRVLRPIIKKKHQIIISASLLYFKRYKIDSNLVSREKFVSKVDRLFAKNIAFKNFICGLIISDFTEDEFERYAENVNEYNRRINTIVRKRVLNTIQ